MNRRLFLKKNPQSALDEHPRGWSGIGRKLCEVSSSAAKGCSRFEKDQLIVRVSPESEGLRHQLLNLLTVHSFINGRRRIKTSAGRFRAASTRPPFASPITDINSRVLPHRSAAHFILVTTQSASVFPLVRYAKERTSYSLPFRKQVVCLLQARQTEPIALIFLPRNVPQNVRTHTRR
jgi:hypothetical protein